MEAELPLERSTTFIQIHFGDRLPDPLTLALRHAQSHLHLLVIWRSEHVIELDGEVDSPSSSTP
jgi:hypothetical protein